MRDLPLDGLHDLARRHVRRWHAQQQVHVVGPNVAFDDLNIVGMTDLTNQLSQPTAHIATKNRLAVLRNEHEVVVQAIGRVSALPVALHAPIVPQAP